MTVTRRIWAEVQTWLGWDRLEPARPSGVRPVPARNVPAQTPTVSLEQVQAQCVAYHRHGKTRQSISVAQAVQGVGRDQFTWIHLPQALPGQVETVARHLHLPLLAVEDAVKAHQRPKVELYDDVVFTVIKPARYVNDEVMVEVEEVALFITPTAVVSVGHGACPVLDQVRQELNHPHVRDAQAHLGLTAVPGPMGVLYRVLDLAVDDYEAALARLEGPVDDMETAVFSPQAADHTQQIYLLKREIAEFRRAAIPLVNLLQQMTSKPIPGLAAAALPYFNDVLDHALRTADALDGHDRRLSDILQADLARTAAEHSAAATVQSQIANQQNEDMRKISAWAAIALVPTAIAGIYGMNFAHMPELNWRYGYPTALTVIAGICLGLHRVFRHNGWL